MSILTAEFDLDATKRVWREETIEDERIKFAKNLLRRNRPIDEIMEDTGLTHEVVEKLRASV